MHLLAAIFVYLFIRLILSELLMHSLIIMHFWKVLIKNFRVMHVYLAANEYLATNFASPFSQNHKFYNSNSFISSLFVTAKLLLGYSSRRVEPSV
jgi:hypothetical protein